MYFAKIQRHICQGASTEIMGIVEKSVIFWEF